MRVVFATNVVVAGIVAEGLCREILEIHMPEHTAVCRDPDDDWVLATALAGDAEAIVSGDADLLTLGSHAGIWMMSPRQFVSRK